MARKDLAPSFSENHCGLLLYCMLGLDGWAFFILLLTIIFFWQWIVVTTVGSSETATKCLRTTEIFKIDTELFPVRVHFLVRLLLYFCD
jgi:hypothetical protein